MGSGRITSTIPDLFSAAPRERSSQSVNSPASTADNTAAVATRHILPNDLPAAIKHLNNQELEQLQAAVTAEQERRGRKPTVTDKTPSRRREAPAVTLTIGKLNAVRAAFKAGVTPSRIAKQFGIPQADVRKVIASDGNPT